MARSRTPVKKAAVTGADKKNPGRHKGRKAAKSSLIGTPPAFLDKDAKKAWALFKKELPWLKENHRAFMEAICILRGKIISGAGLSATQTTTYQAMLSKLGATPADESKVMLGDWGGTGGGSDSNNDEAPANDFDPLLD